MAELEKKLRSKLELRINQNNYRSLKLTSDLVDFTSNDYLGLARSEKLIEKIRSSEIIENFSGSTGSRLLSGNSTLYQETEQYLATVFKSEKALIFNSGYTANLGLLSAIPGKGDTILYDELIHTSLKDGARLSLAQHLSFRHNDLNHLEKKIKIAKGNVFVVAESIYSMDGDQCRLKDLVLICEKYGASLVLDEAHSTGVLGENGNGLACSLGLHERIFARIYTFGKAMGVHGACISGSPTLIDYLINFSRPFIYTTALPPHAIHSIKQAFVHLSENHSLQEKLTQKIRMFKDLIADAGIEKLISSNSAIQALVIESPGNITMNKARVPQHRMEDKKNAIDQKNRTKKLAANLQQKGFDIRPILSPTVKEGCERIRICLHVYNSDLEIKKLVEAIKEGVEEM